MTSRYFPFHPLGLKCNPFRVLTDEEWAEVAILPDVLAAFCTGGSAHLQVLGEAGRGKTTTLLGLATHLRRRGQRVAYEYLANGEHRFGTETRDLDLFCLDEAQRLTRRERGRLAAILRRGPLRVVLGSHEDWGPFFQRHALALTTLDLDTASEAHFRAALERRLEYFALSGAPGTAFTPGAVCYLWETRSGNLRAAERLLYEVFQRLRQPGAITPELLRAADEERERTAGCGAD
jgi:hypothetical protein